MTALSMIFCVYAVTSSHRYNSDLRSHVTTMTLDTIVSFVVPLIAVMTTSLLLMSALISVCKKSKAVPLHSMAAHGGRGGIAPTHT
jgi:hypothetical protein